VNYIIHEWLVKLLGYISEWQTSLCSMT